MTEVHTETPSAVGQKRKFDIGLNVAVAALIVAVLGLGAWFGYTVWQTEQRKEATNAPTRLINALEAQVRNSPNDVILRVRLGEALGSARKFPQAIEQFNQALQIDPNHVGAHLDLGMVAMLTGKDDQAEEYFKKVIELTDQAEFSRADKRRENAFYNLGLLMLRQEQYDQAVGYFKEALRIRKDASDTYLNLARALRGMEDYDGAIEQAEFALAFDPGYAEALFTMGQLYEAKGDKINASYYFYQAASRAPDADVPQEALLAFGPSSDWVAKASGALEAGNSDEALEAALVARNLDPTSIAAVKVHGEVLMARKSFRDALEVYRDGLAIAKDDADINAVIIRIEREHPKDALAAYKAALKKNPDDEELKKKIAELKKASS